MSHDHLALDTEDDSNGLVNIINFYDGKRHQTFVRDPADKEPGYLIRFRAKAWNWLYARATIKWKKGQKRNVRMGDHARRRLTVWACNAEYDLINLFGGECLGKLNTLQYVSSGLLRATNTQRHITFLDTLRHWPMSVEQMGGYLGLAKLEADFLSVEYCRRDTEIVWHFVDAMLDRYRALGLVVKSTLPSMALQLFQKKFFRKPFTVLPSFLVEKYREGYYGGRVEVYRFGYVEGPIRHYDVNSLFPSVMVDGAFPRLEQYANTRNPDWNKEGMAELTITVPEMEYPPLPMRGAEDMVYPWGTMRGMWPYPEIRQALADGATIKRVHAAYEHERGPTPFRSYVEYCYQQRSRSQHEMDNVVWKLFMNSLYGKFGQRAELDMIYDDQFMKIESEPSPAANVIWAAYVTCLARLRLLSYLRQTTACYYTDTDSLFTPDLLPVSKELGMLKLEGVYTGMEAKGNKMYAVDLAPEEVAKLPAKEQMRFHADRGDGSLTRYKAKGVMKAEVKDGKLVSDAARDFIRTGRAVFRKPIRFRESRRVLLTPNLWVEMEKRREAVYTKRRLFADGRTEPWEWTAYCTMAENL
jgi:hypothetical protein